MNNVTFGDDNFGYYETVAGGAGAVSNTSCDLHSIIHLEQCVKTFLTLFLKVFIDVIIRNTVVLFVLLLFVSSWINNNNK